MTQKNSSKIISVVHPICCGLDVHKDMVSSFSAENDDADYQSP